MGRVWHGDLSLFCNCIKQRQKGIFRECPTWGTQFWRVLQGLQGPCFPFVGCYTQRETARFRSLYVDYEFLDPKNKKPFTGHPKKDQPPNIHVGPTLKKDEPPQPPFWRHPPPKKKDGRNATAPFREPEAVRFLFFPIDSKSRPP